MLELQPPPEVGRPATRNCGVLVVDDTEDVRGVVAAAMRWHGFKVWLAADGIEAVELYRAHRDVIDVVLMDVRMPGRDGPQTLAVLRGLSPHLRCCFMSGDLGEYDEADLYTMGALAVFRKPLCLTEVADLIRVLAATPSGHTEVTPGNRPTVADSESSPRRPGRVPVSSPEELAKRFVTLAPGGPGGGLRIRAAVPGEEPVLLGPHANPFRTRDELRAVRRFVAAAIRAGWDGREPAVWSGEDE